VTICLRNCSAYSPTRTGPSPNTKTFRLTAGIRSLWSRTGGSRAATHKSLPAPVDEPPTYQDWVREFDSLGEEDRQRLREMIAELAWRPTFSVLMPVFNPTERHLRGAIESVLSQMYPDWELCIADDASTAVHVRPVLEEYRQRDHRIQVTFRPTNGHIVEASNSALVLARGEFVTLVDHDDEIPAHALACLALELAQHPKAAILYSDEDKLDEQGRRYLPYFKPGWNPEPSTGVTVQAAGPPVGSLDVITLPAWSTATQRPEVGQDRPVRAAGSR